MKTLEEKIEEWKQLKKSKKALEKRIKELRTDITAWPIDYEKYGLQLQERNRTTYDRDKVWEVMDRKGIPSRDFTYPEIDDMKIEQLYYLGALSDDDLRNIRTPRYIYALVEKEVANVQRETSDLGSGSRT